jgi:membrane protease YdiL (CAAX protease family)
MRQKIGFVLIILLIIAMAAKPLPVPGTASFFLFYFCLASNYLIIAILIWVEINSLEEFHLENFSLIIFVISSIFRTRYRVPGEGYFLVAIGLSGLLVVLALILNRSKIPRTKFKWVLLGIIYGYAAGGLLANLEPFQYQTPLWESAFSKGVISGILRQAVNVFSFSAPIEEIIFRGFLWGYLRRLELGDTKILWIQGILFWLLHIYKIFNTPETFFIGVPILTIISTFLVLRSKQVFPALISHALINIIIPVLVIFLPIR